MDLVFGYASLVGGPPGVSLARLAGVRRALGVAMDNAVDLPGYKYYVRADTGARPAVLVAFADLVPAPPGAAAVNGVLLAATDLRVLDARERNYERVDVTARIAPAPLGGRVWAYVGSPAGRERFARGRAAGTLVAPRAYLEAIQAGFRALGPSEHRVFLQSSDLGGVPVMALDRIDLPAPGARFG